MIEHPLESIIRRRTGFTSLQDLLNAAGNYRPSLEVSDPEMLRLANAYDAIQMLRGDPRRAYRYGQPFAATVGNTAFGYIQFGTAQMLGKVVARADDRVLVSTFTPRGHHHLLDIAQDTTWALLAKAPALADMRKVSLSNPPAQWRGWDESAQAALANNSPDTAGIR